MKFEAAKTAETTAKIDAWLDLLSANPLLSLAVIVGLYAFTTLVIGRGMGPKFKR